MNACHAAVCLHIHNTQQDGGVYKSNSVKVRQNIVNIEANNQQHTDKQSRIRTDTIYTEIYQKDTKANYSGKNNRIEVALPNRKICQYNQTETVPISKEVNTIGEEQPAKTNGHSIGRYVSIEQAKKRHTEYIKTRSQSCIRRYAFQETPESKEVQQQTTKIIYTQKSRYLACQRNERKQSQLAIKDRTAVTDTPNIFVIKKRPKTMRQTVSDLNQTVMQKYVVSNINKALVEATKAKYHKQANSGNTPDDIAFILPSH